MNPELEKRIALVAADRESGASELVAEAIAILREAGARGAHLHEVAAALRAAQPSMASLWNATAAALAGHLDRFAQRVARAPDAIARFAVDTLETGLAAGAPLTVVTLSYSGTVARAIEAAARRRRIRVSCSESRPALEGRRLAIRLADAGIPVTFYVDAAIADAVAGADAVLVGADAIAPDWFVNKVGTAMLSAYAGRVGVPVYVLASRDKFAPPAFADRLALRSGEAADVWSESPTGVTLRNPYFERIPTDLVSGLITDVGRLSSGDMAEVCSSAMI